MSQNHAKKMTLIFSFSKQYMILQSERLRANNEISPLDPLKNRFFGFCPLRVLTHRECLAFAFQKDTSAASAIAFCFCLLAFNNKKAFKCF